MPKDNLESVAVSAEFQPIADFDANGCRALWAAVILRALADLSSKAKGHGSGSVSQQDKDRALQWFGSKKFYTVCEFADVDPDLVLAEVERLSSDPQACLPGRGRASGRRLGAV